MAAPEVEDVEAVAEPEEVALPDKVKLTVTTLEMMLDGMVPLIEVGRFHSQRRWLGRMIGSYQ